MQQELNVIIDVASAEFAKLICRAMEYKQNQSSIDELALQLARAQLMIVAMIQQTGANAEADELLRDALVQLRKTNLPQDVIHGVWDAMQAR